MNKFLLACLIFTTIPSFAESCCSGDHCVERLAPGGPCIKCQGTSNNDGQPYDPLQFLC